MSWKSVDTYSPFKAFESGNYPIILNNYELKTTKPEKGSKLMYVLHFDVAENDHPSMQGLHGRKITDWCVVGQDDDPSCEDENTLNTGQNLGVAKIKSIAVAAGVEPENDEDDITIDMINEVLDNAGGQEIIAIVKKSGMGANSRHNINGYVKVGEVPIGLADEVGSKKSSSKPSNNNPKQTAPKSAAAAIAEAKKLKGVKPKAAEVVEEGDEEAALPKPKAVAKAPTKAPIKCPLCEESFPFDKLGKHVESCTGGVEQEPETLDDDE